MTPPRIVLCTICINEMEWLPRLWEQHKDWPGLVGWCFVEGADRAYAAANTELVTKYGLSTDGTTDFLRRLDHEEAGMTYAGVGLVGDEGPQGKCEARNQYLWAAESLRPDWLVILDADEFYTRNDQARLFDILGRLEPDVRSLRLRQRDLWCPPAIQPVNGMPKTADHLFALEAVGGYWDVRHTRFFRWQPGLRYLKNHNWPEDAAGAFLTDRQVYWDRRFPAGHGPECVHMGFASAAKGRKAKHQYYVARGEGKRPDGGIDLRRAMYVDCREAWETWRPGVGLPHGARVIPYDGPVPEVFKEQT